jgi:triacylglycerol lipase
MPRIRKTFIIKASLETAGRGIVMNKSLPALLLGLLLLGSAGLTRADVLVLVHGYLGHASSWEGSGVIRALQGQGWQNGGVLLNVGGVISLRGASPASAEDIVYRVELPSTAPLLLQSRWLGAMLASLQVMHPQQKILLIGHSAGGVVARAALVQGLAPKVTALITIASPHLGTSRAAQALDFTDDSAPVSWLKGLVAGDKYQAVRHSRQLLIDLLPAAPGSLLYALNQQQHPDIDYVSIVRPGPVGLGDELVPAFSQDMNQVAALRGRSRVKVSASDHELDAGDGQVLVAVLATLKKPAEPGSEK